MTRALRTIALLVCGLTQTALAAGAAKDADLAGVWETNNEIFTLTMKLYPGGRYASEMDIAGNKVTEFGRFTVEGKAVTLTPAGAQPKRYDLKRTRDGMEWSGGDIGQIPWTFRKVGEAPAKWEGPADLPEPPKPRKVDGVVGGLWTMQNEVMKLSLLLQPDGTYWSSMRFGGEGAASLDEVGRYEVDGNELLLSPARAGALGGEGKEAAQKRYTFELADDAMTLTGGDLGEAPWKLSPVASESPAASGRSVVGRWKYDGNGAFTAVALLLPDGRYLVSLLLGDGVHELGRYEVKGGTLVMRGAAGAAEGKSADEYLVVHPDPDTMYWGGGKVGPVPWKFVRAGDTPDPRREKQAVAGKWVHRGAAQAVTIEVDPGGSYTVLKQVAGKTLREERGRWSTGKGILTLEPAGGARADLLFVIDGRRMVCSDGGGDTEPPVEFRRRRGGGGDDPRGLDALVGRWVWKDDAINTVNAYDFLPGGEFRSAFTVGGTTLAQSGEVSAEGDVMVFDVLGGEIFEKTFALKGDRLTLSDANAPAGGTTFVMEPGSRAAVVREAEERAAAKAKEDAAWKARIRLGAAKPYGNVAVGEMPRDPQPKRAFAGAAAFAGLQVYQREWRNFAADYAARDCPQPRSVSTFFFRPDGRFFYKDVQASVTPLAGGRGEVRTATTTAWGRYRIEPGETVNQVLLETDAGEPIKAELRDGRRNLKWGRTFYTNVEAALEEVKRGE